MGNSQSREVEEFKNQYAKHGETNDPRYGHVTFYHSKYNPQEIVMVKDKWTNSLTESQEIAGFIENRKDINHPNLAENKHYLNSEDKQWCSTFHKHTTAFEFQENNLDKQIRDRNNFNQGDFNNYTTYSEPELWYIANSVVNVDTTLARQGGSYHGDIQPSTVLLDPQNKVKIIDNGMVHVDKPSYNRMLYDRNVKVALSPLLCEQMQETKVKPQYDPSKEDSWALGMTLLCAGTNTSLEDYYDWKKPEVKRHMVSDSLDRLNGPYSKQLHGFVTSCLEESEDMRPSMEDHERYLKPYQREAESVQLDFKRKPIQTNTTPTPVPVPVPRPAPNFTDIIGGGDFFDRDIQPATNVNFGGVIGGEGPGDFFNTVQDVLLDNQGNFFM